ncbi:MAG: Coenzyme F420 hydrogenase/dehydrogenase, beta subunit C-terminal domain [Candidatus Tectimicrobiota bacterium]
MARDRSAQPLSPQDIIRSGLCIGCGSCVAQANAVDVRLDFDAFGQYIPRGPASWRQHRTWGLARTCPFSPLASNEDELAPALFPDAVQQHAAVGRFHAAYVGHVAEEDFRAQGSSGGMVSWVLTELLRTGMIEAAVHVVATADPQQEGRFFQYQISRTAEAIRAGAKSRYYPVELSSVLRTIRAVPGRYAVVGVPCFIKAVQLLRREEPLLRARIVCTLGLFCGHMKSARFLESFAWQLGVGLETIQHVEFRRKDPQRPASTYTVQLTLTDGRVVQRDWWHLVDGDWGAGFFQHAACNFCDDVVAETADLSCGDAWVEPYASDGRGTNVVIVRSTLLAQLVTAGIQAGRLALEPVDSAFVERTQAAGFRQRREGLAYRLCWPRAAGVRPRKRVAPAARALPARRKLIYRTRSGITTWSHRVFWCARLLRQPHLYIRWARLALSVYHGLAYARGKLGTLLQRWGLP